jgi:2-haloacid dehalogenase
MSALQRVAMRPRVVVFDVVETLASLEPVQVRLDRLGQPPGLLHRWFTRLLRDGMALTAAGDFRPFTDVAASALQTETGNVLSDDDVAYAVGGFSELAPHPDAAAAVRATRRAGMRVITLSNGSTASTQGFLDRAGIAEDVERIISIDDAEAWKPSPAPYELAAERTGVPTDHMALVAVHSWDIHGAGRAGMVTGWCSRLEGSPTAAFNRATVSGQSLEEVVAALAALPSA